MDLIDASLLHHIDEEVEKLKKTLPDANSLTKVCITIPAKNEADYLPLTLQAIANQTDEVGNLVNSQLFEVLVLCHNCTDKTYEVALQFKQENPTLNLHILPLNSNNINNIGAARRVLMHIASDRLTDDYAWIVTTDADTIPNPHWVHKIVSHSDNYDMLCGKIKVNTKGLNDDVKKLVEAKSLYNFLKTQLECIIFPDERDPWPKHNHNSGPSLALRKHVYAAVDGIPPVPFLEDIKLYNRVKAADYSVRHLNNWEVLTSGRLFSKTQYGLGSELKHWSKHEVNYFVEDIYTLIIRFMLYKKIKALFVEFEINLLKDIAQSAYLDEVVVAKIFDSSRNYREMIIKIEEKLDENSCWYKIRRTKDIYKVNIALENHLKSKIEYSSAT